MKRFASMVLLFNSDKTIVQAIDNGGAYVEKIFVGYSEFPWFAYNPKSRQEFKNSSSPDVLKKSKFFDKIELVTGDWKSDEDQRNEIVQRARAQGFDYLIFQDADELYTHEGWILNLRGIQENPNHMIYQTPWINFWRNLQFVLVSREHLGVKNTIYTTCSAFAMNLKLNPETKLTFARIFPTENIFRLEGLCFHLSYVLSDYEVFTKIGTWGHAHQVNKNWFRWKWLAWHPGKRNLNPFSSVEWPRAVPYTGPLPPELKEFVNPRHVSIQLSWCDRLHERLHDAGQWVLYYLKKWRASLR